MHAKLLLWFISQNARHKKDNTTFGVDIKEPQIKASPDPMALRI